MIVFKGLGRRAAAATRGLRAGEARPEGAPAVLIGAGGRRGRDAAAIVLPARPPGRPNQDDAGHAKSQPNKKPKANDECRPLAGLPASLVG
jgi:hypothetical protein